MTIEELYSIYEKRPFILTDTRQIIEGGLFFALRGDKFDGNQFAAEALKKGAFRAIVDDPGVVASEDYILVNDTLATLQSLANYHRRKLSIPVIAITGSNGKTTTKELLASVLATQFRTSYTKGNLNNHIGIPLTLLQILLDTEVAVIEMGANHQREIASYCKIAEPTHALITNCGKAHLEGFGGVEGVRKGKGELYDYIREAGGTIFRNADLPYLKEMAIGIQHQITYGLPPADYQGQPLLEDGFIHAAVLNAGLETTIRSNLVGDYNFSNIMAALAVGHHLGISLRNIKTAVEHYTPSNSRSQLVVQGTNTIILDAYNANPSSMQAAIRHFSSSDYAKRVLILGAMKEMGADSATEHQQLIDLISSFNWHQVILVGSEFLDTQHPYLYFNHVDEAMDFLRNNPMTYTAFLVKGSRAYTMEKVLPLLNG